MTCERRNGDGQFDEGEMTYEEWCEEERRKAYEEGMNGHVFANNYDLVVFRSNSSGRRLVGFCYDEEKKKYEPVYESIPRDTREVVLVGRKGRKEKHIYNPSGRADKIDELAQDVEEWLPSGKDPYEALVEWIESEVRRARGD